MSNPNENRGHSDLVDEAQWRRLASRKIFFGHQSVGDDILRGIRELDASSSRGFLNIVSSDDPASVAGPALVEWHIGRNGDPASKDAAFRQILDKGFGQQGGVAIYKYCFVDLGCGVQPEALFRAYRENARSLLDRYPNLVLVHTTIPLTTVEPGWKAWAKRRLRRPVERDTAAERHHFNQLLRAEYSESQPIFDLAAAESMRPDGGREYFLMGGEKVDTLVPAYTYDGGHLNGAGQYAAARELLLTLASL